MLNLQRSLVNSIQTVSNPLSRRSFASLFSKRKATPKDLEKYDVIIIGCNLGGILSRHFDKVTKGKYKIMVVFDNPINQQYPIRNIYEQQRAKKTEYLCNARLAINNYTANSDVIGVDKILPNENAIILRNGRKIQYDHLVVAMGLKEDVESVKGLEEAWRDTEHPVYTSSDHPTWRSVLQKHLRWHYNFTQGNAFFVIPPYPFPGESKLSPKHSFTVVNANQRFSQWSDSSDNFIKEKLQKSGINVEYGLRITEIDQQNQVATFENLQTKEQQRRDYSNLYVIPPCKPHESLVESGLVTRESNYMLDVNHQTLRHNKYKNIFGLGDINNLPTTKSFWAGLYQVHVVRNNLYRSLKGQSLNALYDGYTKCALLIAQNKLTYVSHYYDNKETWHHLLGANGGILGTLRYLFYHKYQKGQFIEYYLENNKGPPYFKALPSFKELPGEESESGITSAIGKYFATNKNVQQVATEHGTAQVASSGNPKATENITNKNA